MPTGISAIYHCAAPTRRRRDDKPAANGKKVGGPAPAISIINRKRLPWPGPSTYKTGRIVIAHRASAPELIPSQQPSKPSPETGVPWTAGSGNPARRNGSSRVPPQISSCGVPSWGAMPSSASRVKPPCPSPAKLQLNRASGRALTVYMRCRDSAGSTAGVPALRPSKASTDMSYRRVSGLLL